MKPQYPSLVFPDTDIFNERQFPLLLFGTPLYYLQPVEADPDQDIEKDNDCFIKQGLCQALTPAPLGENRDRFLRLVSDISSRKDDYASQLSALTVAAMGSKKQTDDEQRYQIVSSLLEQTASESPEKRESEAKLWQARLVLAIAEMLKQEESELRQAMHMLDAQEMEMFRSLQGDDEEDDADPFENLETITANLESARPQELKVRFKAWLSLMSEAPVPPVFFWLATSSYAADQIFNEYEKNNAHPIRPILQIPLPERIEASPVYVAEQVANFKGEAEETLQQLFKELGQVITSSEVSSDSAEDLLPGSIDPLTQWEELLESHFPAHSHGRASIVFYLLRHGNIAEMMHLETTDSNETEHALVGVLKKG